MTDSPHPLSDWVQAQHLQPDALDRFHAELHTSTGSTLVIDEWLHPHRLLSLQTVFAETGLFQSVYSLMNPGVRRVDRATWEAAPAHERFYHHREITGAQPGCELSPSYLAHLRFRDKLASAPMLDYFGKLLRQPLRRVSAINGKIFEAEHQLQPHSDSAPGRLLCAVLYLSADWQADYGGRFLLYDGANVAGHVDPISNRLLVFSPSSGYLHAVEPRTAAAGTFQRWNYSFWMHS